jgi:oxazoline/thiazoline synthase
MIEKPRLKAHLSPHTVGADELFLLGDDRQHLLKSKAAVRLAPLLDGKRTVTEIAMELGGEFPLGEVMSAVAALERGGHLAEGNGAVPTAAWWEAVDVDSHAAADSVAAAEVQIVAVGEVENAADVADGIRAAGLSVPAAVTHAPADGDRGDSPRFSVGGEVPVVLAEDYLCGTLAGLNERMLEAGQPWLLAKPVGETIWLGPWFRPGETGCWACLSFRLERNRHVETYIKIRGGARPRRPAATPPGAAQLSAGLLARELEAIAALGTSETLEGKVVTMRRDLGTLEHTLIKRPQCPVCGTGSDAYGGPEVRLSPAPKRLRAGGAWRSMSADETLERLEKHVSPITGAVAWLSDLSEPGESGYTFWAGHWFPILSAEGGAAVLRQNVRGRSGGKGATLVQARASAICESLERYSGVFFGDEPRVRGTRTEMADRMLDFEQLTQYSESQYVSRDEWNAAQSSELQFVGVPLAPDREVDWTEAWSLTNGGTKLVPTAYCYYGHPDIANFAEFFCTGDSNGQGAGNTLEEAVMQGLMEVVERDGVAIWWYNRLRVPEVDLDSFDSSWIEQIRREYAAVGREVWALDLTTDAGIPVFAAVSKRVGTENEDLIFGLGAHLEPQMAMTRAFSEMNQFLPAARRDPETDELIIWDPAAVDWWTNSSLEQDYYLAPDPDAPKRTLADFDDPSSDDLAEDIRTCVALLADVDLETFVVDQSRPDIELRTVKVLVPGLRHFWRRLAPGRLYDVPVKMGRLERPNREDELNPKNIWF